jgi:hypothetical protein
VKENREYNMKICNIIVGFFGERSRERRGARVQFSLKMQVDKIVGRHALWLNISNGVIIMCCRFK